MKTKLLKMSRRLWNVDYLPPEVNRLNQIKWARAVSRLGDKWLFAKHVTRLEVPRG